MKVVYLNPIGDLGGAELSLLDIFASLRKLESPPELHLVAGSDGPLLNQAGQRGANVHLLPMPGALAELGDSALAVPGFPLRAACALVYRGLKASPDALGYVRRLRGLIRRIRPALVHSNGFKCHLLTALACPRGIPVIWHIRDFPGARPVVGRLLRWASRGVALVLANSEAVASDTRSLLPGVPTEVVFNAIDVEKFSPGVSIGEHLDRLAGLPSAGVGTLRIGLPATYARWKGQEVFLRAAAQATSLGPEIQMRFYVVGGPIYRTAGSQFSEGELRTLVASLRLTDRAGLIPFQPDMLKIYRALDIVVHASTKPEPFGRTIAEAMSCGRPVIVSAAGGAAELFTPDRDAIGVPPGDTAALAAAIVRLATDPDLRQRLGNQARLTAVERFDRERLGPQLMDVYRRVCKAASPADGEQMPSRANKG